jgi:ribonuclease HI
LAKYHIYTDGSSRGNPGAGGWGMIVMNEEDTQILFAERDSHDYTTNNRMELQAMICAFEYAEEHSNDYFIIYSDSAYVVNSINSWISSWAANGWRNSKKQTVENLDCMQALYGFISRDFFNAEVRKCKGHEGELGNELADALATNNMKKYQELAECWTNQYIMPHQ